MSADVSTAHLEFPAFSPAFPPVFSYDPEATQKMLNLWVGASSVFWAPFWAASTAGLGLWALRQGAASPALNGDLPPAFRDWLSARSLWFSGVAPVAEVVEEAADAAFDIANDVPEVVLKVVDAAEDVVSTAIEVMSDLGETVAETVPAVSAPDAPDSALDPVPALKPTREAAALAVSKTPVEKVVPVKKKTPAKSSPRKVK